MTKLRIAIVVLVSVFAGSLLTLAAAPKALPGLAGGPVLRSKVSRSVLIDQYGNTVGEKVSDGVSCVWIIKADDGYSVVAPK